MMMMMKKTTNVTTMKVAIKRTAATIMTRAMTHQKYNDNDEGNDTPKVQR